MAKGERSGVFPGHAGKNSPVLPMCFSPRFQYDAILIQANIALARTSTQVHEGRAHQEQGRRTRT
jgi:hypothetical protein